MKFVLMFLISTVQAKDLGSFGETFVIKENDLLEVIQAKLQRIEQSGLLAHHQQNIQEHAKTVLERPKAVAGLKKTQTPRQFIYDPSITVPYDLKDHQGQVFHKAGTKVNPLKIRPLSKPLLFIDGDDEDQVYWALSQYQDNQNAKIILINGAPLALSNKHAVTFYFDQGGRIVSKFNITQVPARVQQKEDVLVIEEVLVNAQ